MYFNLVYHTDEVRKYKDDGDRRYVKQVFTRSALQPHGVTTRLHGLKKKNLHLNSKFQNLNTKGTIKRG